MFRKPLFARVVLLAVVFMLLAGSTGQPALAQTTPPAPDGSLVAPNLTYTMDAEAAAAAAAAAPAGGLNYQSFNAIEFVAYNSELSHNYSFSYGTAHVVAPSTSIELILPLDLPQGSELREITVWFRDNSAGSDVLFGLCRVPHGGNALGCMTYGVNTTANGNTGAVVMRTLSGSPIVAIDNYNYSYFLVAALFAVSPQFGVVSARVGYSNAAFLPAIRR